ncbi:hypothetical protein AR687_20655 [Flavobacteriaceae bacterium CRH]|nr:hypothetical protein AR687_20655 [Flavobacteriaceae bacterium CRH]
MKLEEKENYDQEDPYFQNDKQDRKDDIDAPPFDNSSAAEDQYENPDYNNQQDNLNKEEDFEEEDGLDDSNLTEENEEDLENEDFTEEEQNERYAKQGDSNDRNHRGL